MKQKSLVHRLSISIIIPVVCLLSLLFVYNIYSIRSYNENLMEVSMTSLNLYVKNISDAQRASDRFMNDTIASDTNYWYLQRKLPSPKQYSMEYDLLLTIKTHMKTNRLINVGMVYSQVNDAMLYTVQDGSSSGPQLKEYLLSEIEKDPDNALMRPWKAFLTHDGASYMVKIYGWRGAYVLLAMSIHTIPTPTADELVLQDQIDNDADFDIKDSHTVFDSHTIFFDEEIGALNDRDFVENMGITYTGGDKSYERIGRGKYSIIGEKIADSQVSMCVVRPYRGMYDLLSVFQKVLLVLSLLSIFVIPYHIWRIRKYVTVPLKRLLSEIEQVRNENLSIDSTVSYGSVELNQVSEAFREMLERIKRLRIEKYESDLENQKSTLEYMKLQLRPHFFINCLKSIFAMVQNKNYDKIQDMVILVSENLRYMFRDSLDVVTIEQELNYVKNYLSIQELGMGRSIECHMQVDTEALNIVIPPLTIQTFIENSVKYAADNYENLEIYLIISVLKMDEAKLLDITISDNGQGYPDEIIALFKDKIQRIKSGEHVGMYNALWRLQHIYGDDMEYVINNMDGAFAEIVLTLDGKEA